MLLICVSAIDKNDRRVYSDIIVQDEKSEYCRDIRVQPEEFDEVDCHIVDKWICGKEHPDWVIEHEYDELVVTSVDIQLDDLQQEVFH